MSQMLEEASRNEQIGFTVVSCSGNKRRTFSRCPVSVCAGVVDRTTSVALTLSSPPDLWVSCSSTACEPRCVTGRRGESCAPIEGSALCPLLQHFSVVPTSARHLPNRLAGAHELRQPRCAA